MLHIEGYFSMYLKDTQGHGLDNVGLHLVTNQLKAGELLFNYNNMTIETLSGEVVYEVELQVTDDIEYTFD